MAPRNGSTLNIPATLSHWGKAAYGRCGMGTNGQQVSKSIWRGPQWITLLIQGALFLQSVSFHPKAKILKFKNTNIIHHFYCCLVTKLCLTLCDLMDCSLPGSSVHGVSQTRILEWVVIFFSKGSSQPRNSTHTSWISSVGRWILYHQHHLFPLLPCEKIWG